MSDSEKKTTVESTHLFENDFVYVNQSGDLILKETPLFEEQKLASIDTKNIDQEIESGLETYKELEVRIQTFLQGWEGKIPEQAEDATVSFTSLKEEIFQSEAVGDFNKLILMLDEGLEEILGRMKESSDPSVLEEDTDNVNHAVSEESELTGEEKSEETLSNPEGEDYFEKLARKAEDLLEMTDWSYVSLEFGKIRGEWKDGPDPSEIDISSYMDRIDAAEKTFEEKKAAHYEEQKQIRDANLVKKRAILDELKTIVQDEQWAATKEVSKIRNKWEKIRPIPVENEEELKSSYDKLIDEFEDHKVDRLVKKKQKEEENLIGKLAVLDKIEELIQSLSEEVSEWKKIEKDFNKLDKQWSKIGRVPVEKNQNAWDRYHELYETFHGLRLKYDEKYRQKIEKFLDRKKSLINQAEALLDEPDLALAAKEINKLHRRWKKIGNLPQKDENDLWNEFKAATDAFNKKKSENIDELREIEDQNLEEKQKIIRKANDLKESEDWEKTHKLFQNLMEDWKKIGPVPKRQSGAIWKEFKSAMDYFYEQRRSHLKQVKKDRKGNLDDKKKILDQLKALTEHEDPIKAVEEAKNLQEDFKKAGYVPIKFKNIMWKEYRETCDIIYDRFRAAQSAAKIVGRNNVSDFSANEIAEIQNIKKEMSKLRGEIRKEQAEVIQMEESLSYFKPKGAENDFMKVARGKIEKADSDVKKKEKQLAKLEKKMDKLTNAT